MTGRPTRVALVISITTDLLPRVLALDVLEKEFAGGRRALEFFRDRFRDGEVAVHAGGFELDFERLTDLIVADGGDVAGINGLALHFAHNIHSARKSTFAVNSGVRNLSGLSTCTFTCNVPFERFASGAISAT